MKRIFSKKEDINKEKENVVSEKALKKMSRMELLEILIEQSTELEWYKKELSIAEKELDDRKILIENSGSIAEASLVLNGVFEAAQSACQQYTENIQRLNEEQENLCKQMEEDSRMKADKILTEAMEKRDVLLKEAEEKAKEMLSNAKKESEQCWKEISDKLDIFYKSHNGLKEILAAIGIEKKQNEEDE